MAVEMVRQTDKLIVKGDDAAASTRVGQTGLQLLYPLQDAENEITPAAAEEEEQMLTFNAPMSQRIQNSPLGDMSSDAEAMPTSQPHIESSRNVASMQEPPAQDTLATLHDAKTQEIYQQRNLETLKQGEFQTWGDYLAVGEMFVNAAPKRKEGAIVEAFVMGIYNDQQRLRCENLLDSHAWTWENIKIIADNILGPEIAVPGNQSLPKQMLSAKHVHQAGHSCPICSKKSTRRKGKKKHQSAMEMSTTQVKQSARSKPEQVLQNSDMKPLASSAGPGHNTQPHKPKRRSQRIRQMSEAHCRRPDEPPSIQEPGEKPTTKQNEAQVKAPQSMPPNAPKSVCKGPGAGPGISKQGTIGTFSVQHRQTATLRTPDQGQMLPVTPKGETMLRPAVSKQDKYCQSRGEKSLHTPEIQSAERTVTPTSISSLSQIVDCVDPATPTPAPRTPTHRSTAAQPSASHLKKVQQGMSRKFRFPYLASLPEDAGARTRKRPWSPQSVPEPEVPPVAGGSGLRGGAGVVSGREPVCKRRRTGKNAVDRNKILAPSSRIPILGLDGVEI